MTPHYDEGGITIYHGDARTLLSDVVTSAGEYGIVTDPPYGLGSLLSGGISKWPLHDNGDGRRSPSGLSWDQSVGDVVCGFERLPGVKEIVIWGGNYFDLSISRGWLVWDKIVRRFDGSHCELAWTNLDQPVRAFNYSHGQLASEGKAHPTQKPLDLMRWCLGFVGSDMVIDPFMGSGTTLAAARDMGKKAIGIEIEERYCEIAVQRLAQGVLQFEGGSV